jgi:hypothetical protein
MSLRPAPVFLLLAATPAAAAPLAIPQQQFAFDALGTQVTLPITAELDAVAEGEGYLVSGTTTGNLGDLQAKAAPIARAIPFPRTPCANQNGINVVVDSIQSAAIEAAGETARLSLVGTVTGYGCLMGVGAPVATTQVAITAPLRIDVASPTDVGLARAGPVELIAAGLPADLTALLNQQVTAAVDLALAEARTKGDMSIEGLPDVNMEITNAAFFAEGETLMVRFEGNSTMSAETFASLLEELGATAPSGL